MRTVPLRLHTRHSHFIAPCFTMTTSNMKKIRTAGVWRDLAADQNEFGLVALTFNPCTAV